MTTLYDLARMASQFSDLRVPTFWDSVPAPYLTVPFCANSALEPLPVETVIDLWHYGFKYPDSYAASTRASVIASMLLGGRLVLISASETMLRSHSGVVSGPIEIPHALHVELLKRLGRMASVGLLRDYDSCVEEMTFQMETGLKLTEQGMRVARYYDTYDDMLLDKDRNVNVVSVVGADARTAVTPSQPATALGTIAPLLNMAL